MRQHLLNSTMIRAILLTSLAFGGSVLPVQSTPRPIIDSSFNSTDSKTIAEQVRKDAIVKEKLDKTAKVVRIERAGRDDGWMYAPVPYWRIAIADQRQTLVYLTTQDGRFRALMLRNGQPTHPVGQLAQEIAPADMTTAALNQAMKQWSYPPTKNLPQIISEKATWASGCENISAPFPCDPVVRKGWKITVPLQQSRWVFRGETAQDLQLIERTSSIERRLPTQVRNEVKRIAGNHFQLSPAVVLVRNIELQTFGDSCLGLGDLAETCARQVVKGYRVEVAGKANQTQIYRISNDTKTVSAERNSEGTAGLPARTDELPTAIALKVLRMAQTDLKRPIANLKIVRAEPTYDCFRNPTDPPNKACFPTQKINGWKALVTNNQQLITYTLDLNGKLLNKKPS
ncbi:MAG: hypothetical protein HC780_01115 [Leptolyngbyaceae cyanobacterium CSU_1_3]|nr:hypothetical protein [Leptolyngbyaceae cyanobacterium CSU_1_3]